MADELGATPAQVALAWIRQRSPAVLPMIGARTTAQLVDNLGCLDVSLEPEQLRRLTAATGFTPGFPTEFIEQTTPWVFGAAAI